MFLRNYWYAAAWSEELTRQPLGRILLNQPLVFFRKTDGSAVALEDHCPHRGLPLHRGRLLNDDLLECGYHGLTFDCAGRCVKVPGETKILAGADILAYPLLERWGLVWVWMGDGALTDPALLPDWHFLDGQDWRARGEHLQVNCHYQLIVDNLLDMTHLTYVHPRTLGSSSKLDQVRVTNEISDDAIVNSRWLLDIAPPPTYARSFNGNVDRWQITKYQPPAHLTLDAGAAATGSGAPAGNFAQALGLHTFNTLTPETARTCHYFWAIAQRRASSDQGLDDSIFEDIRATVQEDVAVFNAQQRSLELTPDQRMITLKSDAALLAARRMVARLLREESTTSKIPA